MGMTHMGGMHGMHGMNHMMNPMMMGGMNPMMGGMAMHGFNGQNSMLPSDGAVSKCQPLAHGKLCAKYDAQTNKLKINVKVGKSKRKKQSSKHSKGDRYKFIKKSQSKNPFPQYRNPFKSKKGKPKAKKSTPKKPKS